MTDARALLVTRRGLLAGAATGAAAALLSGCGFELRRPPNFAFRSIWLGTVTTLGVELQRQLVAAGNVQVVSNADRAKQVVPDVLLDVVTEAREKVVAAYNSAGQVRELTLRLRFKFRLRTPLDKTLIDDVELVQQRSMSYYETVALAKEAEEALLYRDMQNDIVQQVMRRLGAVREL